MAHNLSFNDELQGILSDIARHRFAVSRQINPQSMLFQTVKKAIDDKLISNGKYDYHENRQLATIDLTQATLSKDGQKKLTELTNKEN